MKKYIIIPVMVFFTLLTIFSCNDEYDEHYKTNSGERSELNLLDYMKSREDLSKFVKMIEKSGYADTLTRAQMFTVFAPTNEALGNIDVDGMDVSTLKKQVGNYLTSYSQSTASIEDGYRYVSAFNTKYIIFRKQDGKFLYGGQQIANANILVKNGLIHILSGKVPYVFNIWEFIQEEEGLDSLRNYVNSLTKMVFDPIQSYDESNVFIDSFFVERNRMLDELGNIKLENYYRTAVLPTNQAWTETYQKLFPYYKSLDSKDKDGVITSGIDRQIARTKWAIVKDYLFYDLILPGARDTLISTDGTILRNPDEILSGTRYELSNGLAYKTEQLRNRPQDCWTREIRIEGELSYYDLRKYFNCTLSTYSGLGTGFSLSNNSYTRIGGSLPTSITSKIAVKFPVPNTLSGLKYNIYCVFVPGCAIDTTDARPYKVAFYLTYIDENGKKKEDISLPVTQNVTNTKDITKMLVAKNYVFPYCDVLEQTSSSLKEEDINVYLRVENLATATEERQNRYSRNLAIDCIILEPVLE